MADATVQNDQPNFQADDQSQYSKQFEQFQQKLEVWKARAKDVLPPGKFTEISGLLDELLALLQDIESMNDRIREMKDKAQVMSDRLAGFRGQLDELGEEEKWKDEDKTDYRKAVEDSLSTLIGQADMIMHRPLDEAGGKEAAATSTDEAAHPVRLTDKKG